MTSKMQYFYLLLLLAFNIISVRARCYEPSPAFPVPQWQNGANDLSPGLAVVEQKLNELIAQEKYDGTSFSIELTSETETLWARHHTSRSFNKTRPGDRSIDGNSMYRIASITKVFTVLGLLYQHQAHNLSLDDPISEYVSGLSGDIPWDDITLRTLASQFSGIPREVAQGDIINEFPDPTVVGLPPTSRDGLPKCDEYANYDPPCDGNDLIAALKRLKPLFAPNQKSTYSNAAFDLIGLALENATGNTYEQYMLQAIFDPLEMSSSTFKTPNDTHAVLPPTDSYWEVEEGSQNPTGGIYSSTSDMSKFLRYVLTHYNAIATGVNWLMPASWAGGIRSFYGMPWEIFRTDAILKQSRRPVTFVTKSGGLPGYCSIITLMPEYGLAFTVLVGGQCGFVDKAFGVLTTAIVQAAEEAIWKRIDQTYTGFYTATDSSLKSALALEASPSTGLTIPWFISNGTDVIRTVIPTYFANPDQSFRAQLSPTLLYKNESAQEGEIWRMEVVNNRDEEDDDNPWREFCTTDMDGPVYAGRPVTEVVFWHTEGIVELPAWELKLKKQEWQQSTCLVQADGSQSWREMIESMYDAVFSR